VLQQFFCQVPGIVGPGEPVDVLVVSRDLAEAEVHGPPTAKPHRCSKSSGDLHRLGDQAELPISTSHIHSQAGYPATAAPST